MHIEYNEKLDKVFEKFGSSSKGLSKTQVEKNKAINGANSYKTDNKGKWQYVLLSQFQSPITILLLVVVGISLFTGDHINSIVILLMIGINTVLGFVQELKAYKSLERLKKLIKLNCKVLRDGSVVVIDSTELVPGDVILLSKGNIIPADLRLIESQNLLMNEAPLTGESVEVAKQTTDKEFESSSPQDITNHLFQGTSVAEGSGKAIVVATGQNTLLGRSIGTSDEDVNQSNYVKNINKFSKILFYFVIVITVLVFCINIYFGRDILQSLILGITLALGITPETMPLIISIALSTAAYRLSKENVLIKRISAFEDFGNVDVICTDKTGTITKGILEVESVVDTSGVYSDEIALYSALCGAGNPTINGGILENTIDTNIWKFATEKNLTKDIKGFETVKSWDLDFAARNTAVIIQNEKSKFLVVKGAHEEVCRYVSMTKTQLDSAQTLVDKYESEGYKVITIAKKQLSKTEAQPETRDSFKDLELIGYILLKDQPRLDMKSELVKLAALHINLKILTGDSINVTKQICQKVDLDIVEDRIISGLELEQALDLSLNHFDMLVEKYNVFARVDPMQKLKIIESLKRQSHVVAYIGDGINDVGALKVADVGIAVDTAVDVAKDSADIIILDHKLTTIAKGVEEGRKIFANTMKFIFSTMSSSFGNVITIVFASIFLKFIPLLPVQIILLDSLSDFQHLAVSTDNVDHELTDKPHNWDFKIFIKYVIFWGLISTLFDFFHIYVINKFTNSPETFRTAWLIESVTTEILATFALRTHLRFYKSKPGLAMILLSILPIVTMVGLIFIPSTAVIFGLQAPSLKVFMIILFIVALYMVALEIIKKGYFRKFWGTK